MEQPARMELRELMVLTDKLEQPVQPVQRVPPVRLEPPGLRGNLETQVPLEQ